MEPVGQMSNEQLQALIQAMISSANVAGAEGQKKSKGSIASCTAAFCGQRDHEAVEEFITAVETYKEVEQISDEDALKGLALLLRGIAATWWQGVRKEAKTWKEAMDLIREHFSPVKPPYQIYLEIFEKKQDDKTPIDTFVCHKRALLAQLPDGRHDEKTEIDLIYGLLNIKYRRHIARDDVNKFKDLLEKGRIIEHNNQEELNAGINSGPLRGSKASKRCTYCNYRGHTFEQCRKRKSANAGQDHPAEEC